ncbi:MAG: chorismate synthase [Patescibacteria group bacterium]
MSGNIFGNVLKVATFGESHGAALGCILDGVPAGIKISVQEIQKELNKRRPGQSKVTTSRQETDQVEILSGIFEGLTLGTPIALLIRNQDQKSADYNRLKKVFRPGHADLTWQQKFGLRDFRGGGRSSGRETVARVAASAIAKAILNSKKIKITAFAKEIAGIVGQKFDAKVIEKNPVRAADLTAARKMEAAILAAQRAGDSVGGLIEVRIQNCPAGLGEPVFDKLSARLGAALLSIGGVKGIEFGVGFGAAKLRGSEMNDQPISLSRKKTNRVGGISGGISDGSEIILRIAIRPTASIALPQKTIDHRGKTQKIQIAGRHDPCLVPRIVPVAEAMVALTLADLLLARRCNRI